VELEGVLFAGCLEVVGLGAGGGMLGYQSQGLSKLPSQDAVFDFACNTISIEVKLLAVFMKVTPYMTGMQPGAWRPCSASKVHPRPSGPYHQKLRNSQKPS